MEYTQITYDVSDKVATITLNRPDKLNAFTGTMMYEMIDAFEAARVAADCAGRTEWYPGTEHGFAFSERPMYVKEASERHWERLHDLFDRTLRDPVMNAG